MAKIEQLELFDIQSLEQITADLLLDGVSSYIRECNPLFPSRALSLELIERVRETNFVEWMIQAERERQHTLLSHSLLVCVLVADVSRQLNIIYRKTSGNDIVDEPLVISSSLFHDIGNVIYGGDIEDLGLEKVDISRFTAPYPEDYPRKDVRSNHILRTIAFLQALGFPEHASAVAHGIYHLINDSDIPLERVLLILADFSVVDSKPREGEWLRADFVPSLTHKMDKALARHRGELKDYLRLHDMLQERKSDWEKAGVIFPGPLRMDITAEESKHSAQAIYLRIRRIAERGGIKPEEDYLFDPLGWRQYRADSHHSHSS